MKLIINKTLMLNGIVTVPSSKSQSIRSLFLALLSKGQSILTNILISEDVQNAINICNDFGAKIQIDNNTLYLQSNGLLFQTNKEKIYSGNSGIATLFMLPMTGLRKNTNKKIIVDCGHQMRARPVKSLVNALRYLGLHIEYIEKEGNFPLIIDGELRGGKAEIEGVTSQYLSSLLISLPCAHSDSEITVRNLNERPYVEMTLNWLKSQQIIFTHKKMDEIDLFKIKGNQRYKNFNTTIAGDFSSASCIIAAAALIPGYVEIYGLDMSEPQGDKRIVTILKEMGADISILPDKLIIHGGKSLKGLLINANDIPDLLPALAIIGTHSEGKTEIRNVPQARIKETDRIHSMTVGLRKMGAKIDEYDDGMTVHQSELYGANVKGFNDHRTVMALSIAGLIARGETTIEDGNAIDKTFPTYVNTICSLGANMGLRY